jgi:hypothetical protein
MLSVMKGVQPRDQLEAMLAAQMAAVHMATMTIAQRLAHVENIPQQDSAERAFNKLSRTFTTQMEALKRYRTASFLAGLRSIASYPFFGSLRLAKAHPFPSPVILDEINPSGFECAADSRLNGQGNRYLPVYNLGSSDGCHADF